MRGIIQIYSMVSVEDARAVSELGADHVGIMVARSSIPYTVDLSLGRNICRSVRGISKCVVLPISHNIAEILDIALSVEADIVQIASYEEYLPRLKHVEIYEILKSHGLKVIRVIPVGIGGELDAATFYSRYSDYIMLDTYGEPPTPLLRGFIGGTGKTHDWSISREIIKASSKPVILAGGLNPDNVSQAIKIVKPFGVDAATSLDIKGSGGRKDLLKVKAFIEAARRAWDELDEEEV
ncbi:MAG: phosphoribosylanthranilate isomerase [Sulfolobales archaeon]